MEPRQTRHTAKVAFPLLRRANAAWLSLAILCFAFSTFGQPAGAGKPVEGLSCAITALAADKDRGTEVTTALNVWLFVSAGQSPAPFLPAGKFSATWTGFIFAE